MNVQKKLGYDSQCMLLALHLCKHAYTIPPLHGFGCGFSKHIEVVMLHKCLQILGYSLSVLKLNQRESKQHEGRKAESSTQCH